MSRRRSACLALALLLAVGGCRAPGRDSCAEKTGDGLCAYTNDLAPGNAG